MRSVHNVMNTPRLNSASTIPNLITEAFYDDTLQRIVLTSVTSAQFEAALQAADPTERNRILALIAHELRHWLDSIGTLWGQQMIVMYFNAVHARASVDPYQLYHVKAYFDNTARCFYSDYYTEIHPRPKPEVTQRWRQQPSIGHRFAADGTVAPDKKILFARFTEDDELVARCPLTVASLLEAGAMHAELRADITGLIAATQGKPIDPAAMTAVEWRHRFYYEPSMVRYSVAAHLTARFLGLNDPLQAFTVAAALATFSLNLPGSAYSSMRMPDAPRMPAADFERLAQEHNPGFAFYFLLCLLDEKCGGIFEPEKAPTALVEAIGQRSLSELHGQTLTEMTGLEGKLLNGKYRAYAAALLAYGRKVFNERGVIGQGVEEITVLQQGRLLPPIVFADNRVLKPTEEGPAWADLEERWRDLQAMYQPMAEFVAICGL